MLPTLETDRLRLRALRPGDEVMLAELDADADVMRHIHHGPMTPEEARCFAESRVEMAPHGRHFGTWLIEDRETGAAHGWVGLYKLAGPRRDDLQLGYELHPLSWGRGVATEAGARLLQYGFETLKLDRVMALVRRENLPSQRVLAKLGLRPVGRQRDDAAWSDLYQVTREEWTARRA